jgi:predicted nuclease of predicted toxin-antitoxin system
VIAAGHDVLSARTWPEDPGDRCILEVASEERRVLVTADKDFGELAIVHRLPHAGIIRLVDIPAQAQRVRILAVLNQHGLDLEAGAIVTAERGRIRIRRPDPPNGRDQGDAGR